MAICGTQGGGQALKSRRSVLVTEIRCVFRAISLLIRNRLALPRNHVGRTVTFADGTRSVIYRESAMRHRHYDGLVLIAVRFRLRLIGSNRIGHWLFRVESLLNTVLFAAHPGFETKLWLTDLDTGFYRGIYEWRGSRAATEYADTLMVVLGPWVERASVAYEVIEGHTREEYLAGALDQDPSPPDSGWWRAAAPLPTGRGASR